MVFVDFRGANACADEIWDIYAQATGLRGNIKYKEDLTDLYMVKMDDAL